MEFLDKIEGFLSNQVKTQAVKNWTPYKVKKEWLTLIFVSLLIKLSTNAVSVFSGYQFLNNCFFALVNSEAAARSFAVITLLLIELFVSLMLAKFFKFAFRLDFAKCILPFLFAAAAYFISCQISCKGIAIYAADGADMSAEINGKYNTQITSIRSDYKAEAAIVQEQIDAIKANPAEWKDGRRCVLSNAQMMQLNTCYDRLNELKKELNGKLDALKIELKNELQENDAHTVNEADKYLKYVAIIMAVQIIFTALLWFFWAWIAKEERPDIDEHDTVKRIYDHASSLLDSGFSTCMNTKFNTISTAFALLNSELQAANVKAAEALKTATEQQPQQPAGLGFRPVSAPAAAANLLKNGLNVIAVEGPLLAEKIQDSEQVHSEPYRPVVSDGKSDEKNAEIKQEKPAEIAAPTTATTATTAAAPVGYLGVTTCKNCGKEFVKRSWNNYYCCKECKDAFWAAQGLNLETIKKRNSKL